MLLHKTIIGSRLYGTHHEGSDYDYFMVVTKRPSKKARYAKQTIVDGLDSTVVDFGTFMMGLQKGVPQYCEAALSRVPSESMIKGMLDGLRFGSSAWATYLRTIKSMVLSDDYKRRRHSLRLAMNLSDLRRYGRFDPTLNDDQLTLLNDWSDSDPARFYDFVMELAMTTDME